MNCSNCGHELAPDVKFCSNCGAPVQSGASSANTPVESNPSGSERDWGGYSTGSTASGTSAPPPPPAEPQPTYSGDESFTDRKPTWEMEREKLRQDVDDEWSMASLGPARPQRKRTWLWVLLGLIAFMIIACCVFGWWITATESGTEWFEGIATQAAEEIQKATEQAATPQP